jgi:ketosteroid isomerase-like protein
MSAVDRGHRQPLSHAEASAWVSTYERAWRTAGTKQLRDLFTQEASYRMSPYEESANGLAEIAELWERERQGPDEEFEMTHEVVAVEGETAVIRVEVHYGGPNRLRYRDLWIVRIAADGRCREFEEWPFWPGQKIVAQRGNG